MIENDIPRLAREKGEYLLNGLKALKNKYPSAITDVRGIGLMIGMEFPRSEIGYSVAKGMFARRVMTAGTLNNSRVIRFEPAATTSLEDFDKVLSRLDEALSDTVGEFGL
jgi:putrescine aminotransferase